ncbi:hypothetical protein [Catenovulum sediminis]|uniref:Uncharacterized protein n=1 Tax=Catenovulum sediminis TaxID=1740262 RepID=A0ABV1RC59_9ALTE|nr:hypothetical protein [Catenovulum sediminis]
MNIQTTAQNRLNDEWVVLQKAYDKYEALSLGIKIFSIALAAYQFSANATLTLSIVLLAVCWLQDAIWKTFQARIDARLIWLEVAIKGGEVAGGFEFNLQWSKNRPSTVGLIKQYIKSALKPTVMFPYIVLILAFIFV